MDSRKRLRRRHDETSKSHESGMSTFLDALGAEGMTKRISTEMDEVERYFADREARDPEFKRSYEEVAPTVDLWLALHDARHASGLTQAQVAARMGVSQAQVARIERQGNESYTLNTLRRYVRALGDGFKLNVTISRPDGQELGSPLPDRYAATKQQPVK
jgi:ribosome-binding protein aMBF1 (putative translation factor)